MCMSFLPGCMSALQVPTWSPHRPCIGSHGTGITDSSEQSLGRWELNPGPLEDQQLLNHLSSLEEDYMYFL